MSEIFDAAGDLTTGAAIAHAVEPAHGEAGAKSHGACYNCATMLIDRHCHVCGQKGEVHRTLGAFWHDFLHSILHFDGKFFRTLPLLAWKPGELTRRYIYGERAKFVSPLALFLFSIFLLFAAISVSGGAKNAFPNVKVNIDNPDTQRKLAEIDAAIARQKAELTELSQMKSSDQAAPELAASTAAVQARLKALGIVRTLAADGVHVSVNEALENPDGWKVTDTGSPRFDAAVENAMKDPKLLAYKLKSNGYKYSWALIPISVPFVWLLFAWRREFKLFDHAVFVTYSLCFMSFLLAVWTILPEATWGIIVAAAALYVPFHLFRHLKGGYLLSTSGALIRLPILLVFCLIALLLEFALLFYLGLD